MAERKEELGGSHPALSIITGANSMWCWTEWYNDLEMKLCSPRLRLSVILSHQSGDLFEGFFGLGQGFGDHLQAVFLILNVSGAGLVFLGTEVLDTFALVFDFDETQSGR